MTIKKSIMKTRIISILTAMAVILSAFGVAPPLKISAEIANYTELQANTNATVGDGTVQLTKDISGDTQLTIARNLTLDLNGYTLDINLDNDTGRISNGIQIGSGITLTIIDSSADQKGELNVTNGAEYSPSNGCGAAIYTGVGTLIIESGTVNATGGANGAGIGGGIYHSGGTAIISGGTVNATGGISAAGIGGGNGQSGGNITISGGIVTAVSVLNGAGIGGGYIGAGGNVTITGGEVTAKTGSHNSLAIGYGGDYTGTTFGTVKVDGEFHYWTNTTNADPGSEPLYGNFEDDTTTFDPTEGYRFIKLTETPYNLLKRNTGAVIGTDIVSLDQDMTGASQLTIARDLTLDLNGNKLDIATTGDSSHGIKINTGVTLTIIDSSAAQTGTLNVSHTVIVGILADYGAAISTTDATLIIESGTVNATGGFNGAGIGGGFRCTGGTVIINGGTVNATGGNYAAGIGGGAGTGSYDDCHGGTVIINGGNVTAKTGNEFASAIGGGRNAITLGTVTVDGEYYYWANSATNTDIGDDPLYGNFASETDIFAPEKDYKFIKLSQIPYEYTITVNASGTDCGTASADYETAASGTDITLTATPTDGYHFVEWVASETDIVIEDNMFTMTAKSVTITAVFEMCTPVNPTATETDCTVDAVCKCGYVIQSGNAQHDLPDTWTVRTAATCIAEGLEFKKCSRCVYEETQPISALNHDLPDTWTVRTAATCETAGLEVKECSRCVYEETQPISALNHDLPLTWTVRTAATCEIAGLEVKECSRCDYEEIQPISALNHDLPLTWTVRTAATCETSGIEVKECSRCDYEETQPISALSHTWETNGDGTHNCTKTGGCGATETCSPDGYGDICGKCGYVTPVQTTTTVATTTTETTTTTPTPTTTTIASSAATTTTATETDVTTTVSSSTATTTTTASTTTTPVTTTTPEITTAPALSECNYCDRADCAFCSENGKWVSLGNVDGSIDSDQKEMVTIFDALEILKFLVGMDGVIKRGGVVNETSMKAAQITVVEDEDPTIFCALEILKFLVGMDSRVDGIHINGKSK